MARRQWLGGAVLILGSVSALGGAPLEAQVSTQIADLARGPSFFEPSIDVHVVHELGDRLLFPVTLLSTEELWSSDGTPEGTFQLTAESQRSFGSSPVLIAQDRGLQVWLLQGEYGGALWRTDGSRRGTALLSRPEPADFKAKHHVNASGRFPIFENGLFYPGQTPEGDGLFAIDLGSSPSCVGR